MFDGKEDARAAKKAQKRVRAHYTKLQEMLYEGIVEVTLRTSSQTLVLHPSQEVLNPLLTELSTELYQRYRKLDAEQLDLLDSWVKEEGLEQDKKRQLSTPPTTNAQST